MTANDADAAAVCAMALHKCRICKQEYPLGTHFQHKVAESGSSAFYNCCTAFNESIGTSCLSWAKKDATDSLQKGACDTKALKAHEFVQLNLQTARRAARSDGCEPKSKVTANQAADYCVAEGRDAIIARAENLRREKRKTNLFCSRVCSHDMGQNTPWSTVIHVSKLSDTLSVRRYTISSPQL